MNRRHFLKLIPVAAAIAKPAKAEAKPLSLEEAKALYHKTGFNTEHSLALEDGIPWEEVMDQRCKEAAAVKRLFRPSPR